jgi:hypothetical protein
MWPSERIEREWLAGSRIVVVGSSRRTGGTVAPAIARQGQSITRREGAAGRSSLRSGRPLGEGAWVERIGERLRIDLQPRR